ncbi:MAG: magnesium chelatase subunit I [Candidatus Woesearchaeota archaeon]|nr:MAG: magnesium chelatase subunit I [Candidatus Woesearchaeota archaeon]
MHSDYSRPTKDKEFDELLKKYSLQFKIIKEEMAKVIVGQTEIINSLIEALLCNGHVLVEGVPGIAKTMTVRTLSTITGGQFSRIQFTPDLLPTDIIGITTYEEGRGFYSVKGPIFANFVLADEINRAPPKVQSALLEAMQERQVTIGKESFALPNPFFVMATQNPIESLGTYKLPEAQIDRFMFKLQMNYPNIEDELKILHQNVTLKRFEDFKLNVVINPETILKAQQDVKRIYLDKKVEKYIVSIVESTRNPEKYKLETGKFIEYGTSPRSSIALFIASKAHALVKGKGFVTPMDVKEVAHNVLRHRIILNYEGQAEEISTDKIIDEILKKVPIE